MYYLALLVFRDHKKAVTSRMPTYPQYLLHTTLLLFKLHHNYSSQ